MNKLPFFLLLLLWIQACLCTFSYDVSKCGIKGNSESHDKPFVQKVMGGVDTKEGEYPFTVAIYYKNKYICTGVLISPRHVLTAAHCFASPHEKTYLQKKCATESDPAECLKKFLGTAAKELCQNSYLSPSKIIQDYEIGFGSHNLSKLEHIKLEAIDPMYKTFFQNGCLKNDITILTLVKDDEKEAQRPYVCLSYMLDYNYRNDIEGKALGWGYDPIKELPNHDILQELDVAFYAMKFCLNTWNPYPLDGICVQETHYNSTCKGDSGGPLIGTYQDRDVLVGILSSGTSCDDLVDNKFIRSSIYTRIDFYQQKLNDMIGWKNENFDSFNFTGIKFV